MKKFCKVYIAEKDLLFHENQIHLNNDGELEILDAVYCDTDDLYIVVDKKSARTRLGESITETIDNTCPNGHLIYHHRYNGGCGGCASPWCNIRCKCHSRWNN